MTPTVKWPQRLKEPAGLPGADEIHLWQTDLDEPPTNGGISFRTLSSSEQERARRFVFEEHRRRYLAARAWLRSVLGAYLNSSPHAVPLVANAHGKPCIAGEVNRAGLQFNLSHCDRLALLAVAAGREIGVDLQGALREAAWPAVAGRFCTPDEWEHVQALPPATRAPAFAEIWTRKEAAGEGLTSRIFSIAVGPASWGMVDCGGGLFVWSLPAQDRFAAAIAVRQPL
ncbi:MAG: 4'-phosphopantetheinyl transferase superfamily protein [Verrucomicrobiota bacterium]|jgi:4'-phosphopantetheinyl transferase